MYTFVLNIELTVLTVIGMLTAWSQPMRMDKLFTLYNHRPVCNVGKLPFILLRIQSSLMQFKEYIYYLFEINPYIKANFGNKVTYVHIYNSYTCENEYDLNHNWHSCQPPHSHLAADSLISDQSASSMSPLRRPKSPSFTLPRNLSGSIPLHKIFINFNYHNCLQN